MSDTLNSRLWTRFKAWRKAKADHRRREAALNRYGWDGKCAGCGKWHHGDSAAMTVASGPLHWDYKCECGGVARYALIYPIPVRDMTFMIDRFPLPEATNAAR